MLQVCLIQTILLQTMVGHNPLCTCARIFSWLNEYTQKGNGWLEGYIYLIFSWRDHAKSLYSGSTTLYSYQQHINSSIILNLLQNVVLPDFIFCQCGEYKMLFYYDCNVYYSYANKVEHLLTCLLVIYVLLPIKCLFIFFAHFSIRLFIFFSLLCSSSYILDTNPLSIISLVQIS